MAQVLTQFHRGNRPPQFLFAQPHYTGRKTVSGAEIVETDWFVKESAGLEFDGLTVRERQERNAKRWRVVKIAVGILAAVGLAVGMVILP